MNETIIVNGSGEPIAAPAAESAPAAAPAPSNPYRQRFGTRRPFMPVVGLPEKAQANGEALVTALWVAHRAARRLRRQAKARLKALMREAGTEGCPVCEWEDHPGLCDLCTLIDDLRDLINPDGEPVALGQAADVLRQLLKHFDLRDRIERAESCLLSAHRLERDDLE